jgi:hypothetical protein
VLINSLGTGNEAAKISGIDGDWEGLVYAPNGNASVQGGQGFVLTGGIHAWTVSILGNTFSLINDDAGGGRATWRSSSRAWPGFVVGVLLPPELRHVDRPVRYRGAGGIVVMAGLQATAQTGAGARER